MELFSDSLSALDATVVAHAHFTCSICLAGIQ